MPGYGAAVTGAPPLPCVLVTGAPASGKTVLGRALATRLGATLLDLDVATAPLTTVIARLVGQDDLDGTELARTTRAARYETLTALAEDNLRARHPVVLVAPFTTERREPAAWARLSGRLGAAGGRPVLAWLRTEPALLLGRLRARAADRDRAKLADLEGFLDRVSLEPPAVAHVAVDAAADLERQCSAVLRSLA